MTTIYVVQNDQYYAENFTLNDANGSPINLTGATLVLNVQAAGNTTGVLKFTGSMSITSALLGTCYYTVQPTDFDTVGTFNAEILITYSGSPIKKVRYTDIQFVVKPALPVGP